MHINALYLVLPMLMLNSGEHAGTEIREKIETPFSLESLKMLSINDSTDITLKIKGSEKTDYELQWSTNFGQIREVGDRARYYAPDHGGLATILLKIMHHDEVYIDSLDIMIYKQLILLKADDLSNDRKQIVSSNWRRFLCYVKTKNIKASLGLIATSLEKGSWNYIQFLRDLIRSGHFEIWNHGYNHLLNGKDRNGETYHEFCNTPFEYQKEHLLKAQKLAKNMLHITLYTFGAPGNAIDDNTALALDEIDDIKIWYYGLKGSEKMILERTAEIEFPTHHPDFDKFIETYDPTAQYLALQIHPRSWDEVRFGQFEKIIDYLIARGVTFINPHEYYSLSKRRQIPLHPRRQPTPNDRGV